MIQLYNGDCLEVMDKLIAEGIKVDAIICDPPYGTTACKWDSVIPLDKMWKKLNLLIKKDGAIAIFGQEPFSTLVRSSNIKKFKYDWLWEKENGSNFATVKYQPFKVHEIISIFGDFPLSYTKSGRKNYNPQFSKGEPYTVNRKAIQREQMNVGLNKETTLKNEGIRYPKSIIKFNTVRGGLHKTQKPIKLMEYLIKTYTNEGDTVLDFTMGSGTTGIASINTNRNFIGIELDETYFNIAKERIENEGNQLSIF